jgi:hypothetical protein
MNRAERRAMIERENPALAIAQQCRLLAVSRSAVYRKPVEVSGKRSRPPTLRRMTAMG